MPVVEAQHHDTVRWEDARPGTNKRSRVCIAMPDRTPHQKKIIERYYVHRDDILLGRLGEIVTDLTLADTDRKRDQLWRRAEQTMMSMKVPGPVVERILEKRDPEVLARQLRTWLEKAKK